MTVLANFYRSGAVAATAIAIAATVGVLSFKENLTMTSSCINTLKLTEIAEHLPQNYKMAEKYLTITETRQA